MKKLPIIYVIAFLMAVLPAISAHASVAADLSQAEGQYKAGQYTQAEQSYLKVVNGADPNKPAEADAAFNARKKLPLVYIATDRLPQAKDAVQQLLSRYAQYEFLPHAIHEIVEGARDLNKTAQAGQAYSEILKAQPGHSQAIWLKMGVALADVYLANGQAVDAGVKDIIARHSTEPWSAEALAQIGWAYDKLNLYAKARPLYEYVVDNWQDKPRAIHAHTALIRGCIRLRDKQAAQARLDQLAKRYATDPQLPRALNEIARGCREAQMYQETRPISRHVLDRYSGHEQCIWAQRDLILCDVGERNQEAAQAGLQVLIKNYADNGYLPYVLNEIAAGYRQVRMYGQAESVSQYVLDNFPGNDQCLWAQRDVVLSNLALKNLEAAAAGAQELQSRFAKQAGAIWAVSEVAETYSNLGQHEQARNLFRFNLYNYTDLDDTIWSLRGFVAESVALKDQASIDAGIKKLFSEYSASKNLPMAAVHIGRSLSEAGHARASELFQYVIDKHPGHEQAIFAKVGMGYVCLRRGQDNEAETIFQKIPTDYAGYPTLPEAMMLIAYSYWNRAFLIQSEEHNLLRQSPVKVRPNQLQDSSSLSGQVNDSLQKAIVKAEAVMTQFPVAGQITARACHIAAECYRTRGEPKKALEYYEKIVSNWPDYENAPEAQFMIGRTFEQLKRAKVIPEADANATIRSAYERLVTLYPNSPGAKAARQRLTAYRNQGGQP